MQNNIGQFGGDKNNVTVDGQSAGAGDTVTNMVSPLAAGLFHRAIAESGFTYTGALAPLPFAETRGTAFAVAAGCGSGSDAATAKCLRSLTAGQVETLAASGVGTDYLVEDGRIIPGSFTSAFQTGRFNHMPLMNGTTQDEGNFNLSITEYNKNPRVPFVAADFTNYVTTTYSGNAGPGGSPPAYPAGTVDKVLARYPLYAYATPQSALDAVMTDVLARRSFRTSQLLASQAPVYGYEFDDRTAPYYFPKMPGFQPLAAHTIDIEYLFPLYHGASGIIRELNNKQENLSDQLVTAWANFDWTGNPNGIGNSPWPRYKGKSASYYLS